MNSPFVPTNRNVERLLKELTSRFGYGYQSKEVTDLNAQYEEIEKELLKDKRLLHLRKLIDVAHEKHKRKREGWQVRIQTVRRTYLAKGLTPSVVKMLADLVDDINKEEEESK